MERWTEYFKELLESEPVEKYGPQIESREEEDYTDENKVTEALAKLTAGKSAGSDGISPEKMKNMGSKGIEIFQYLLNFNMEENHYSQRLVNIYHSRNLQEGRQ